MGKFSVKFFRSFYCWVNLACRRRFRCGFSSILWDKFQLWTLL